MGILELATDRLLLRAFAPSDAPDVQQLVGIREMAATVYGVPYPYPDSAASEWIALHASEAERGAGYTWAITHSADHTLMGAITLHIHAVHQRGEIGYWVGMPFWNQGVATEAARPVVAHGFDAIGLHRIQALCLPSNHGSARVLEKIGFQREGVMRDYVAKWGNFEDRAIYGLLRDEWLAEPLKE